MMGIPPTGQALEWTEIHVGRFAEGRLVEHWGQIDVLRIMQAIGAVPGVADVVLETAPPRVQDNPRIAADGLRKLVERYAGELWSDGRLEAADELVHPDAVHLSGRELPAGPKGMKRDVELLRAAVTDLRLVVEDTIVEYPYAVGRFTATGTHGGDFMGIPRTGRRVAFGLLEVLQVSAGTIVARWSLADLMGLLGQLG